MLKNKEKGFTIIEVVLVLAIAGLIFLVVFLALPALQRSQRDTARRQDVGKVVSALQSYMSDNKNDLPGETTTWSNYYNGLAQATTVGVGATASTDTIQVVTGKTCGATNDGTGDGTSRNAAVIMVLETSNSKYCESV